MKKKRKSEDTIDTCVESTKELEKYLEKQRLTIDDLTGPKLETFTSEYLDKKRIVRFLWSLSYYFLFINRSDLLLTAQTVRNQFTKKSRRPFKLKAFRGVQSEHMRKLAAIGIEDVTSMIEKGKTQSHRQELAVKTDLDLSVIEEYVKLSDLSRLPGVKGIRARLYHDAGFDTCLKISKSTKEEILETTKRFVEETRFDGIAPLPKEVASTIETAKKLSDVIEW